MIKDKLSDTWNILHVTFTHLHTFLSFEIKRLNLYRFSMCIKAYSNFFFSLNRTKIKYTLVIELFLKRLFFILQNFKNCKIKTK